jgi:16S rRNA (cytosine967-C5)-methyltransferase
MKDSARLQTVIELLGLAESEPRPSDGIISAYFRARRFIGSKDRSAIASRVYDLLRHHARLEWWLTYLKHPVSARAKVLAYLRLVEGVSAAEVAVLCDNSIHAPATLSDEEKTIVKTLEGRTLVHPDMPQAVACECPDWAYEKLQTVLGKDFAEEMQAMLTEAPLDLRVNIIKASREEALEALEREGIRAEATLISPLGIRVSGRPALAQTELFKNGWVEIQDEGSQMVAVAVDAQPGMSVVDFCAGAGGKTLAIAAAMNNKGRVVACDVLGGRLKRARERFRRADLHNIEVRELSSETDDWVKRNAGKYDRVLVDAPCSGTGVWRRNPDARWKKLGPGLEELVPLQARILKSAARLVKAGGKLVYATCSLLPDENEEQVDAFLAENPSFKRAPQESGDDVKLTPAKHGTDGFFAAVLQKV